jgi:hypothetical protein
MKTKRKIQIVILMGILSVAALCNTYAQQERYYAAFVYQFTRYINLPNIPAVFVIAVVGNSSVTPYLQEIIKEKKIGSSAIVLMDWKTPNDIGACNVLFVPQSQKANLPSIINKVGDRSTLIITESPGTTSNGADISFLQKEGKIQFVLNKTQMQKKSLSVSSDLEKLAATVY